MTLKPVKCACGRTPIVDDDEITGVYVVECMCGRCVAATGRQECFRMWNIALRDARPNK